MQDFSDREFELRREALRAALQIMPSASAAMMASGDPYRNQKPTAESVIADAKKIEDYLSGKP